MNLREALTILGPERVSRGMRAIDDPLHDPYGDPDRCERCFVGQAFGGEQGYTNSRNGIYGMDMRAAALEVEAAYEGWNQYRIEDPSDVFGDKAAARKNLRAECVAYLAEHGSAPEVVPAPHGIPAVFSTPEPAVASCGVVG